LSKQEPIKDFPTYNNELMAKILQQEITSEKNLNKIAINPIALL